MARLLLLDTHAVLWWAADDERSPPPRGAVAAGRVLLSVATPRELTIKHALGRLELRETTLRLSMRRHDWSG